MKNIVSDIVMLKPKRSLRDVLPGGGAPATPPPPPPEVPFHREGVNPKPGFNWLTFGVGIFVVVVLIAGYLISLHYASATVTVTPKQGRVLVDATFTASPDGQGATLTFKSMVIEGDESQTAKANGTSKVEKKATGDIVIYNNYSKTPQKLVANTRFQSTAGKIYRITQAVTVPGQQVVNGQIAPGALTVKVTADKAGPDYNSDPTDFTIPGFKGQAQFSKFYARSKSAIAGGFSGEAKTVAAADEAKIRADLTKKLQDRLTAAATAQLPAGFVLYPDAIIFSANSVDSTTTPTGDTVTLAEHGKLAALVFDAKQLSQAIAERGSADTAGADVLVANFPELTLKMQNKDTISPTDTGAISFSLSGNALLVWQFDDGDLRTKLATQPKNGYQKVITSFPAIERANASFWPIWLQSFPKNPASIQVKIVLDR